MAIYVGTICELQGTGYEILVDSETKSQVLGHFYDGKMISFGSTPFSDESVVPHFRLGAAEKTLIITRDYYYGVHPGSSDPSDGNRGAA